MKVLLFSVTAGEGHNASAKAIARELEARGAETKIVDAYRLSGRFMYKLVDKGYLFIAAHFKRLFGLGYRIAELRRGNSYRGSFTRFTGRRLAKKFKRVIEDFDPDVIVSTHSCATQTLDIVKQRHGLRAKTLGIVTDFTVHPFWEDGLRLDRLILPCEPLLPLALKKGFREEQIRSLGIPINPKFSVTTPKNEAREALGIDKSRFTLMIMSGSMGYGNILKTLRKLDAMPEDFQMIVVCGNNKKMHAKIEKQVWHKPLLNFGFTDKIPLLMDASDVIITKPGGLTTSESLSRCLPMIIRDPIPGHEAHNVRFLTGIGAAVTPKKGVSLEDTVRKVLSDSVRADMITAIEQIRKPNAVRDLCDEIILLGTSQENS